MKWGSFVKQYFLLFLSEDDLIAHVCTVHQVGWGIKTPKKEQGVDCLDVTANSGGARVMIKHKLFNETCNDSLIAFFVATGIGNVIPSCKVYIDSLPKDCGLKL